MKKFIYKSIKYLIFLLVFSLGLILIFITLTWKNVIYSYTVLSGSMEPTIKTGSLVIVKITPFQKIKAGDIIAFHDPYDVRKTIIHRVAGIKKGENEDKRIYFITKGDTNKVEDQYKVMQGFIIGKYYYSIAYLGYILNILHQPMGAIFIIVIPSLIITIIEFINFNKHLKHHYEKKIEHINKISVFFCLFFSSISIYIIAAQINVASASFTAKAVSEELSFTSGDWLPPSSIFLELSDYQSESNFPVNFKTTDINSKVKNISLYYRYNNNDQILFQTISINPEQDTYIGNFNFTSPEGDGLYEFYLSATDISGNSESPSSHISTTVDTALPSAALIINDQSGEKNVRETINNGDFELGNLNNWTSSGSTEIITSDSITNPSMKILPYEGSYMIRIGKKTDPGNWVWENRLMGSFISDSKTLSLYYNFVSRDFEFFDDPGFFIRLNGQEIFKLSTSSVNNENLTDEQARSTGWKEFTYDLSDTTDQNINLSIYAGNTGDKNSQSWVYIDNISTFNIINSSDLASFVIKVDEINDFDKIEYKIYKTEENEPNEWQLYLTNIQVNEPGYYNFKYRVIDKAGNTREYLTHVKVYPQDQKPATINDLRIETDDITSNSLTLAWTSSGSKYDVRFQKNCHDSSQFNFDESNLINNIPSPQEAGKTEILQITGLDQNTEYCLGIKTANEASIWSEISNIAAVKTLEGNNINPGDIVINEMAWAGSSVSSSDEWLELRNLTDHQIDLSGFYLTRLSDGNEITISIDFSGYIISPNGYFLIADGNSFGTNDSQLNIAPNIWNHNLSLSNSELQIKLYSQDGDLIDTAWDQTAPKEGYLNTSLKKYYSMERTAVPGDGTNPLNWYTCIDEASTADFFDGDADDRGTPGAPNRSENEPLAHAKLLERNPALNIILDNANSISFTVLNTKDYQYLSYELIYESEDIKQGIIGEANLDNQELFSKNSIILGTCSSGGTCNYHKDIKNIKLSVNLKDKKGQTTSLEKVL